MKKLSILLVVMLSVLLSVNAQIKTPLASPRATIKQEVGLTEVEVEYCRPSARGREVFGHLVRFGKLWRTGANANTIVYFSEDVVVDGKNLSRGSYSIYTLPNHNKWLVYFYKTTNNWGLPEEWKEENIVLEFEVDPVLLSESVETLTINFTHLTNKSTVFELVWEKTRIAFEIKMHTDDVVMKGINAIMNGPTHEDYFASAQYYFQSNKESKTALKWIDKALKIKPEAFWYWRLKGLLHYRMGDTNKAIDAVKTSLTLASKDNNTDYIKLNTDSIDDWTSNKKD